MNIIRLLKGLIGVALITVACFTIPSALRERGEALRLFKAGGSQEVYVHSKKTTINARLLAVLIVGVPSASLISGVIVFLLAVRPKNEDAA
jgi:hypothetical protein